MILASPAALMAISLDLLFIMGKKISFSASGFSSFLYSSSRPPGRRWQRCHDARGIQAESSKRLVPERLDN